MFPRSVSPRRHVRESIITKWSDKRMKSMLHTSKAQCVGHCGALPCWGFGAFSTGPAVKRGHAPNHPLRQKPLPSHSLPQPAELNYKNNEESHTKGGVVRAWHDAGARHPCAQLGHAKQERNEWEEGDCVAATQPPRAVRGTPTRSTSSSPRAQLIVLTGLIHA